MAMTLVQAARMTNDVIVQGVAETIIVEAPVLDRLPFNDLVGSALTWNEENALGAPTTYWYAVGDTWQEATFDTTQKNKTLTVLGGDADIDEFLAQTYRNPNDLVAETLAYKAKAVGLKFTDAFINGDSAVTVNQFDGIKKYIGVTSQRQLAGATGAALTLSMLDQFLDLVKPGKPDVLLVSRRTRRNLKALWRTSGASYEVIDAFGMKLPAYDGIPILLDDNISEAEGAETGLTGTGFTSMYAIQFGMKRGVVGLTNGGLMVQKVGPLETKNASRYRIKWYCSIAVTRPLGVARLGGLL